MSKKKSFSKIINSLVDDDGLKTEVTVTMTDETLLKVILALLASGASVMLIYLFLKNQFPNKQLQAISSQVAQIKNQIK